MTKSEKKADSPDREEPDREVALDDPAPSPTEATTAPAEPPSHTPDAISAEGASHGSERSETVWSRRNVLIAGAALAASVGGTYWAMRSAQVGEQAEKREQQRQDWELPPSAGPAINYTVMGGAPSRQQLMALPRGVTPPSWFAEVHDLTRRQDWILSKGGAWVDDVAFRLMLTNLRRSVVVQSAWIRFLHRGDPLDGTLVESVAKGGSGEISEIPMTGADLDNERPALRMLDVATRTLGDPFPAKQITLGPNAVQAIDVRIGARRFHSEFELVMELYVDGHERVEVAIRKDGRPFQVTGRPAAFTAGLSETGMTVELSSGKGRLEPKEPARIGGPRG